MRTLLRASSKQTWKGIWETIKKMLTQILFRWYTVIIIDSIHHDKHYHRYVRKCIFIFRNIEYLENDMILRFTLTKRKNKKQIWGKNFSSLNVDGTYWWFTLFLPVLFLKMFIIKCFLKNMMKIFKKLDENRSCIMFLFYYPLPILLVCCTINPNVKSK